MPGKLGAGSIPSGDARLDRGYGSIDPKFHKPRSAAGTFPYVVDDAEEAFVDEETLNAVGRKYPDYQYTDTLSKNKKDPFYFAGSATKLSEAPGLSPIPDLYKGKQAVSGGTAASNFAGPTLGYRSKVQPTGTKRGWSSAFDSGPELGVEEIDVLPDPDVENLLRQMVSNMHLEIQNSER